MVVTLYGSDLSSTTLSVALVMWECNVPYKFVSIDMTKYEHKTPEYKEKQPFGCVPYIVGLFTFRVLQNF